MPRSSLPSSPLNPRSGARSCGSPTSRRNNRGTRLAARLASNCLGGGRMFDLRRREFITLLGGAAVAWPLAAGAQQPNRIMRIGVLGPRPENTGISGGVAAGYPAMLDELRKLGYSEGRNLTAEFKLVEQDR